MLRLSAQPLKDIAVDLVAVLVSEDQMLSTDTLINGLIDTARATEDFKGRKKDALMLYRPAGVQSPRVLFVGMGRADQLSLESFRIAAGSVVKRAVDSGLKSIVIIVPDRLPAALDAPQVFDAVAEGADLANHVIDRYKKAPDAAPLSEIRLFAGSKGIKKLRRRLRRTADIVEATKMAREWVSLPSNDKTPAALAALIKAPARKAGLQVTIFSDKMLQAKRFGAILAVGAGSQHRPRLLVMTYTPKQYQKTIALVGKGITFDSGGINLKPSNGIEDMKADMAGAAAVAGTLLAVAAYQPKHRVVGVMPLVENMPSGSALRPGDIIRTYSGKTVEVGNTDAEGRLVLADALSWVIDAHAPDAVIDLATLTGACIVALGEKVAGVFTPDDGLAQILEDAAQRTGERCWRMPLPEDYTDLLKSELADINNMSSSRWGGAITAALFLKSFVGETRWAHVDIAGPAYAKKPSAYGPAGGSGFGVRLLCEALQSF